MKKLLAMTLALAMMLAVSVPALAFGFGGINDINFDGKFELEFTLEDLIRLARETGVDDPENDPFTFDGL